VAAVKDGFFYCRLVRGSNKKSCPGAAALRVGRAAFLHNVIIGH